VNARRSIVVVNLLVTSVVWLSASAFAQGRSVAVLRDVKPAPSSALEVSLREMLGRLSAIAFHTERVAAVGATPTAA